MTGLKKTAASSGTALLEAKFYQTSKNLPIKNFLTRTGWHMVEEADGYEKYRLKMEEIPDPAELIACSFNYGSPKAADNPLEEEVVCLLDHLAVAVRDIDQARKVYHTLGYICGEVINDPRQDSQLSMCFKEGYDPVELVTHLDEQSPTYNITGMVGDTPYHLCYRVKDVSHLIREMQAKGIEYEMVSEAKPAVLFGNQEVTFIRIKGLGLIELLADAAISGKTTVKNPERYNTVRFIIEETENPLKFLKQIGYHLEKNQIDHPTKTTLLTLSKKGAGKVELLLPAGKIPDQAILKLNKGLNLYQLGFAYDSFPSFKERLGAAGYVYHEVEEGNAAGVPAEAKKIIRIDGMDYAIHYQKTVELRKTKENTWEVRTVNEEKLFHKSYLLPLKNPRGEDLLKLPIYELIAKNVTGVEFRSPRNATEAQIAEIWQRLLGVERIGINDNFFALGGHSLLAVTLISEIAKVFRTDLSLQGLFDHPTVAKLAELIGDHPGDLPVSEVFYQPIKKVEEKEYYPVSAAQKRMYVLNQIDPQSIAYNITQVLKLDGEIDRKRLKEVMDQLIDRHETLRTSFELLNDQPVQRVHPQVDLKLDDLEFEGTGDRITW